MVVGTQDKIIYDIGRGASPRGFHFYSKVTECPRKARLGIINPSKDLGSPAMQYGIITHAYLDLYHTGRLQGRDFHDVILTGYNGELDVDSLFGAQALMKQYMSERGRECFGKVVGTEVGLSGRIADAEVTGYVDMVVESPLGGVIIVDHKTESRRDSLGEQRYLKSLQLMTYQELWNQCNPGRNCDGVIINALVKPTKYKAASFYTITIPPNGTNELDILQAFYSRALALESTDACNPLACVSQWEVCRHLSSGLCKRY